MKLNSFISILPLLVYPFCSYSQSNEVKELPAIYFSNFKLSSKDTDSIYTAAFGTKIVKDNIANNFNSAGLLFERNSEVELLSVLRHSNINNEIKKKLLLQKIILDQKKFGYRPSRDIFESLDIKTREEAIQNFRKLNTTVFSWKLFIINGVPEGALDIDSYQKLLRSISKMTIKNIKIQPSSECIIGNGCLFGTIIITGTKNSD